MDDGAATTRKKKQLSADERKRVRVAELEERIALSWDEDGDITHGMKIVILKHMFDPKELERPETLDELREDVASELQTKCGDLDKITVFRKHPEGVMMVKFKNPSAAAACVEQMNGRWFDSRRVECHFWDNVTDYRGHEDPEEAAVAAKEEAARLESFGRWLEEGGGDGDDTHDAADGGGEPRATSSMRSSDHPEPRTEQRGRKREESGRGGDGGDDDGDGDGEYDVDEGAAWDAVANTKRARRI